MPTETAPAPLSALLPFARLARSPGAAPDRQPSQGFVRLAKIKSVPNTPKDPAEIAVRATARTQDIRGDLQLGLPTFDVLTRDDQGVWDWVTSTHRLEEPITDQSSQLPNGQIRAEASNGKATVTKGVGDTQSDVVAQEPSPNGTRRHTHVRSQRYPGARMEPWDWDSLRPVLDRHDHWVAVETREQATPKPQQDSTDQDSHSTGWDPYSVLDRPNPEGRCTVFQAVLPVPETQLQEYIDRQSAELRHLGAEARDRQHDPGPGLRYESGVSLLRDIQTSKVTGRGILVTIFGADTAEDAQALARSWVKGVGLWRAKPHVVDTPYTSFHEAFNATATAQADPDPLKGAPGLSPETLQRATVEIPGTDLEGIGRFHRTQTALNQPEHLQRALRDTPEFVYETGTIVDTEDGEHGPAIQDAREKKMHTVILGATGSGKTLLLLNDVASYVTAAPPKKDAPPRSAIYVTRKKTAAGEVSEEQILANMLFDKGIPVYVLDLGNMDLPPVLGNPFNPQGALDGEFTGYQAQQAVAFASAHGMNKQTSDLTYEMWLKYVKMALMGETSTNSHTMTNDFGRQSETGKPIVTGTNPPFGNPLHARHAIRHSAEAVGYTSTTETGQTSRWVDGVAAQLSSGLLLHAMEGGNELDWQKVFSSGGVLVIKNGHLNDAERDYLTRQLMIRMQFEIPRLPGQEVLVAVDEAASIVTNQDTGDVVSEQVGIIRQAGGALEVGTTDGALVPGLENGLRTKIFMGSQGEGNQKGVQNLSGMGTIPQEMIGELATYRAGEALMLTPGAGEPVRLFTTDLTSYIDGSALPPELEGRAPLHDIAPLLIDGQLRNPFSLEQIIDLKDRLYESDGGNALTKLIERITINAGLGLNRLVVSQNEELRQFWKSATPQERDFFLDTQIDVSVDGRIEFFQQLGHPERAAKGLEVIQLDQVKQIIREKVLAALEPEAQPSEAGDFDRRLVIPGFEGILPKAIVINYASSDPTPEELAMGNNNEYQIARDEYPPEQLAQYLNGERVTGIEGRNPVVQANSIKHKDPAKFILAQDPRSEASIIERTLGSAEQAFIDGELNDWKKRFETDFISEVTTADGDIVGPVYLLNAVLEQVNRMVHSKKMDNPGLALVEQDSSSASSAPQDGLEQLVQAVLARSDTNAGVVAEALAEVGGQIADFTQTQNFLLGKLKASGETQEAITAALITELRATRAQLERAELINRGLAQRLGDTSPVGQAASNDE